MNLHQAWTNKENKLIKTTKCPDCKHNTLNHYEDGTEWCGMCCTFSYPIKQIKTKETK